VTRQFILTPVTHLRHHQRHTFTDRAPYW